MRMNGVSVFVPSVSKLMFYYNSDTKSSQLLMLYIQSVLPSFAMAHGHIEVAVVSSSRSDAQISALYHNGKIKMTDASLLSLKGIVRAVEELAFQRGNEQKTLRVPVITNTRDALSNCNQMFSKHMFCP